MNSWEIKISIRKDTNEDSLKIYYGSGIATETEVWETIINFAKQKLQDKNAPIKFHEST